MAEKQGGAMSLHTYNDRTTEQYRRHAQIKQEEYEREDEETKKLERKENEKD